MQKFNYTRHGREELLVDFLVRRFPYLKREEWLDAVSTGAVKVNNRKVRVDCTLENRDVVSYDRPRSAEPEIDESYHIVYEDDDILVVEKSGNIPIAESGRYYRNTLINILKEREGFPELFAVHRLDRETSGIILIAKNRHIAALLGRQFSDQIPRKKYMAILRGMFSQKEILVDRPIKKNIPLPGNVRIRQIVSPTGKPSKTLFRARKVVGGLTLAQIELFTGRTHQIRCHAEFIGYPVLGDKLYGNTDEQFLAILGGRENPNFPLFGLIDRQLLHASSLEFRHPSSGEWMRFESDYRKEFEKYDAIQDIIEE